MPGSSLIDASPFQFDDSLRDPAPIITVLVVLS